MDGAFTAVAPEPIISVEPTLFREAMARLGAAVHIVTSAGPGGKTGFTATAVCSVSDTPATLLVCLNRRSKSAPLLSQNGVSFSEVSAQRVTLEQAYLELTRDAVEFHSVGQAHGTSQHGAGQDADRAGASS